MINFWFDNCLTCGPKASDFRSKVGQLLTQMLINFWTRSCYPFEPKEAEDDRLWVQKLTNFWSNNHWLLDWKLINFPCKGWLHFEPFNRNTIGNATRNSKRKWEWFQTLVNIWYKNDQLVEQILLNLWFETD